jgi:hypothetical protein
MSQKGRRKDPDVLACRNLRKMVQSGRLYIARAPPREIDKETYLLHTPFFLFTSY